MILRVFTPARRIRKMENIITLTLMVTIYSTFTMVCFQIIGFYNLLIMITFTSLCTEGLGTSQFFMRSQSGMFIEALVFPTAGNIISQLSVVTRKNLQEVQHLNLVRYQPNLQLGVLRHLKQYPRRQCHHLHHLPYRHRLQLQCRHPCLHQAQQNYLQFLYLHQVLH